MGFDAAPDLAASGNNSRASEFLQSLLRPGERVVWTGRPAPRAFARHEWFATAWGAVCVAMFLVAIWLSLNDLKADALLVVPFFSFCAAIAVWLVASPLRNALRASRTYYAVTTHRVLIMNRFLGWGATGISPAEFARVTRYDMNDDRGSVRLRFSQRGSLFGRVIVSAKLSDGLWGIGDFRAAMLAIHRLMTDVQA